MKIEILHPITHGTGNANDGQAHKTYGRGIHDLPNELAEYFLTHKDNSTGLPIARRPEKKTDAPAGKVEDAPVANREKKENK